MTRKPKHSPLAVAALTCSLLIIGPLVIGAAPAAYAETPQPEAASSAAVSSLAATPPMGFNNWNAFGCDVNETLIKATADVWCPPGSKRRVPVCEH